VIYERDKKKSVYSTQKVDIYLNFVGMLDFPEEMSDEQERLEEIRIAEEKEQKRQQRRKYYERSKQKKSLILSQNTVPEAQ